MKINNKWLKSKDTIKVMDALKCRNNQVLFVGGCVRNSSIKMMSFGFAN